MRPISRDLNMLAACTAVVVTLLLLGGASAAAQDPIYMTPDGAGDLDGSSWDNAYGQAQFQDALNDASDAGVPLWVAAGEYDPGATLIWPSGAVAYGGFAVGDTQLDQRDISANETTISGGGERAVVETVSGATDIRIDGFTIADGYAEKGGGIYVLGLDDSSVIANCRFENCEATGAHGGGGIAVDDGTQGVVIENCVFYQNSAGAWNIEGAGIAIRGTTTDFGINATIRDCIFEENQSGQAPAIGVVWSTGTVVERCQFINNTALSHGGGAMRMWDAEVVVQDCLFLGNTAASTVRGWAGAITLD